MLSAYNDIIVEFNGELNCVKVIDSFHFFYNICSTNIKY